MPPKIAKKITRGCTLIFSFKKNGRKKLSRKLIQNPERSKNKIPFQAGPVKIIIIPIGAQTIAEPKSGIKEANISTTEKSKAAFTPNIFIKIKAAAP